MLGYYTCHLQCIYTILTTYLPLMTIMASNAASTLPTPHQTFSNIIEVPRNFFGRNSV